MKKRTLLNSIIYGYDEIMNYKNYKLFKDEIIDFKEKNKDQDYNDFVNKLKNNYPHFEILHNAFLRKKISKIELHLKTIKIIIVIFFILGIISSIFLIDFLDKIK